MNHTFLQSIKTITESLIKKAGFDKTRTGNIVGRNELTNTYSVKIDGNVYNNVRVVNDCTYNVGDTVKVSIPCNQASQMYIMSSVFSDDSIGKKIVHADSVIDALEAQEGSIVEIDGHIYQLNLVSSYSASSATYTGQVLRDGEDVTSSAYWSNFHWYLLKNSGAEEIETGISNASLTMPLLDYKYGTSLELVWEYNEDISLRRLIVLFDNEEITKVSNKAFDAYGIASNTAQYFWYTSEGSDTGVHITKVPQDTFEENPQGYNLLARNNGVAIRNGENELATFTYNSLNFKVLVDNTMVSVAEYGANGARIGQLIATHTTINSGGMQVYADDGVTLIANLGYGLGESQSGTDIAPYYTFGTRESGSTVGNYSMAIGENITASGWRSYAEGFLTVASGGTSHAEGNRSVASGSESHAEGYKTTASSSYTHAEGYESAASGIYSHAEGVGTTSSGARSHAEGSGTTSSGAYSHAEGYESTAFGNYSHAQNRYTVANGEAQTAIGKYNQPNTTSAFIIGNGTSATALSNAFTVGWDGHTIINTNGYLNNQAWTTLSVNGTNKVSLGVGSGGENHGVYSNAHNQWIIYHNNSSQTVCPTVGSGTTTSVANVNVSTGGVMQRYTSSSRRYKENIEDVSDKSLNPERLYDIPIRQFKYKDGYITDETDKRKDARFIGFIVEEMLEHYPLAVDYNDDDLPEDWNFRYLIPPMLKLIQDQKKSIDSLEKRIAMLEN